MSTSKAIGLPLPRPEPLHITLGCEFEFLLVHYVGKKKARPWNEDSYNDHGKAIVRDALAKEPLLVRCKTCKKESRYDLPLSHKNRDEFEKEGYHEWQVAHDSDIEVLDSEKDTMRTHLDDYNFYAIEVKSRILHKESMDRKVGCKHPITFAEEIEAVLNRLNDRFGGFGEGPGNRTLYHILVNSKCGFHVHIGNENRSFPLSTVKRVLSIFIACERQIDGFHTRNRISGFDLSASPHELPEYPFLRGTHIDKQTHNLPMSMFYMAGANKRRRRDIILYGHEPRQPDMDIEMKSEAHNEFPQTDSHNPIVWDARRRNDVDAWLTLVHWAPGIQALLDLYAGHPRSCTVEISNLPPEQTGVATAMHTGTIEFRQHAGTLNPEAVFSWIEVLIRLVEFSHNTSDESFDKLVGSDGLARSASFDSLDLCRRFKCFNALEYYEKRLATRSSSFSTWLGTEIHAAAQAIKNKDPMGWMAVEVILAEYRNSDPRNVKDRIATKLIKGGYGEVPKQIINFLSRKNVDVEARKYLLIGWQGRPI